MFYGKKRRIRNAGVVESDSYSQMEKTNSAAAYSALVQASQDLQSCLVHLTQQMNVPSNNLAFALIQKTIG